MLHMCEGIPSGLLPFDFQKEIFPYMFEKTSIFIEASVEEILFDGIKFCDPKRSSLGSKIFCTIVTLLKIQNIRTDESNSKLFSFLNFVSFFD